jgi:RNA polymerase sigma-70 factor (ECF subfamily)
MVEVIRQPTAFQELDLATRDEAERQARFTALVLRQSRFVFRIAYSILRNPDDAEDVVQDTFLKLYRSGSWEKMANEKAFLARAVWRLAVDRRAKTPAHLAEPEPASRSTSPETAAVDSDWIRTVRRLIEALPEPLRQPLALSALEELSCGEIADLMGIAEGTVRTRILRARRMLKQKIAGLRENRDGK